MRSLLSRRQGVYDEWDASRNCYAQHAGVCLCDTSRYHKEQRSFFFRLVTVNSIPDLVECREAKDTHTWSANNRPNSNDLAGYT